MAAAQASLVALASPSSVDVASNSSAVDVIKQSQQGFAKLEAEAKKAEAAKAQSEAAKADDDPKVKPKTETTGLAKFGVDKFGTDDETKANVDRVTALYLDNAVTTAPAKRAA